MCEKIVEELGQHNVESRQRQIVILSMDNFYRVLDKVEQAKSSKGSYNFDHPGGFDMQMQDIDNHWGLGKGLGSQPWWP